MSRLGMHHAVQEAAVTVNAAAHAGAHRQVQHAVFAFRLPEGDFSQYGAVYIRIKAHRTVQFSLQSARKVAVNPRQLGCGGNIPVFRVVSVQLHRPEAGDSQCVNLLVPEIVRYLRHGFLRCGGGNGHLLPDLSVFISYGTYHLGTARFQCSQSHVFFLSYFKAAAPAAVLRFLFSAEHARLLFTTAPTNRSAAADRPSATTPRNRSSRRPECRSA